MIKIAVVSINAFIRSGNFHLSTLDSASEQSPTPQQHILATRKEARTGFLMSLSRDSTSVTDKSL